MLRALLRIGCLLSLQGLCWSQQPRSRITKLAGQQLVIPVISTPENSQSPPVEKSTDDTAVPIQFAIPYESNYDIHTAGVWEATDDGWNIWRLQVNCPGAVNVNLGMTDVFLPGGVALFLYDTEETILRAFTDRDNKPHGELWTPIITGESVVLEVNVPANVAREEVTLTISSINSGFRSFGTSSLDKSGSCNVDVVCSEGDDWRDEISSVGAYSQGGSIFCTGALINNAQNDGTPYFLTAYHCGVTSQSDARSLVVYWNYETSSCGRAQPDGDLSTFQIGASFRAASSTTDFSLLELDEPPEEQWGIHFAGWDRSGSTANKAIAIHHPQGDEKRISFEDNPTTTTFYGQSSPSSSGTHIRVDDWDLGTTEPGSSGSPLFDENHRIIGQLHGGFAACSNNLPDWYGRLSLSWEGGGRASRRLKDWLDPASSGAIVVDTTRIVPGPPPTPSPTMGPTPTPSPTMGPTPTPPIVTTPTPTPPIVTTPSPTPPVGPVMTPSPTPPVGPVMTPSPTPPVGPVTTPSPSTGLTPTPPVPSPDDLDKGCSTGAFWFICLLGELLLAIVDFIVGFF